MYLYVQPVRGNRESGGNRESSVPEMVRGNRESVSPHKQVSASKNVKKMKNTLYVHFCLGQPHSGMKNQK